MRGRRGSRRRHRARRGPAATRRSYESPRRPQRTVRLAARRRRARRRAKDRGSHPSFVTRLRIMLPDTRPLRRELERRAAPYARLARWEPVPEELDRAIAADLPLAEAARALRVSMTPIIGRKLSLVPM